MTWFWTATSSRRIVARYARRKPPPPPPLPPIAPRDRAAAAVSRRRMMPAVTPPPLHRTEDTRAGRDTEEERERAGNNEGWRHHTRIAHSSSLSLSLSLVRFRLSASLALARVRARARAVCGSLSFARAHAARGERYQGADGDGAERGQARPDKAGEQASAVFLYRGVLSVVHARHVCGSRPPHVWFTPAPWAAPAMPTPPRLSRSVADRRRTIMKRTGCVQIFPRSLAHALAVDLLLLRTRHITSRLTPHSSTRSAPPRRAARARSTSTRRAPPSAATRSRARPRPSTRTKTTAAARAPPPHRAAAVYRWRRRQHGRFHGRARCRVGCRREPAGRGAPRAARPRCQTLGAF